MRIRPPEVSPGDVEGFTPENDLFDRKPIADGLTSLLTSTRDPIVIALDAQWGEGKTVFLKMWAGDLRKEGFPVVYFDAFANDFADDPFTSLAGGVIQLVQAKHKEREPAAREFLQKAKGAGKVLLRSGLRLGVKVATMNAVDMKEFEKALEAAADEVSELEDRFVGQLLTTQRESKATLEAFRDALSELPALLSTQRETTGESVHPLVFIIDELDRCRPTFALALLERVKHFFSVPNVHFVLGTHLGQLRSSVATAYGAGIDAETYLQKFIHVVARLPDRATQENNRVVFKYISYLVQVMEFKPHNDLEASLVLVRHVAAAKSISLRTLERIMANLAIVMSSTTQTDYRPPPLVAGLCIMKVIAPDEYARVVRGDTFGETALNVLELNRDSSKIPGLAWHRLYWQYFSGLGEGSEFEQLKADARRFGFRTNLMDVLPWVANNIIDRVQLTSV